MMNDCFGGLALCHEQDKLNTLNSLNIYWCYRPLSYLCWPYWIIVELQK